VYGVWCTESAAATIAVAFLIGRSLQSFPLGGAQTSYAIAGNFREDPIDFCFPRTIDIRRL
jgi:hypothetical protein